ncbi:MAG: DoxX family protein [Saprospiraceae bacterium]|nr:DoxX family protein [Saprospiraceae bacterium]
MSLLSGLSALIYANTIKILRWAIGINYLWFGALKFFHGLSPAEHLAKDTIRVITFGLIPDEVNLALLAIWEVAIGLLFISGRFVRFTALAAVVHMLFTFLPLFFFPEVSFSQAPYAFTIVGQYIVKNLVFLGALAVILKDYKTQHQPS